MRDKILYFLEKNSKLTAKELAVMLDEPIENVEKEIEYLEKSKIICGYNSLINWDKTDKEFVTALIEVRVTPQRDQGFDKIAERIYKFKEVKAVYLMSGGFDLTVIIEGKTIKDIAFFVSDKLSTIEYVLSTDTHFVLKKYKDHGIVLEDKKHDKDRMVVSP